MLDDDLKFMKRTLELARQGAGLVSPNPLVGAVLAKDGRIVGEGYHLYADLKHAETVALERAGDRARGATLYSSLEPCSHQGRTPPCTRSLIKSGISRAVIAVRDSNPRVNGQGIRQLEEAGIRVDLGLCSLEALKLNECYFKFITERTPFFHEIINKIYEANTGAEPWMPSHQLLAEVSNYDAMVLCSDPKTNAVFLDAALSRKRHRPYVIVGTERALRESKVTDAKITASENSLLIVTSDDTIEVMEAGPHSIIKRLAGLDVTGCFVLTDPDGQAVSGGIPAPDKLTLIIAGAVGEGDIERIADAAGSRVALVDMDYRVLDARTEVTAYVSRVETGPI